jgi:hypothetical protein
VKNAQLQIDGAAVKPELLGTPIPLNPGTHALVVFATGRRPFHVQVTVSEGSAVTQAAELVPEVGGATSMPPPAPAPATPSPAEPRRDAPSEATSGAKTWVLIGEAAVAAAGVGVGIGYLAAANAAQTRVDDTNRHIDASSNGMGCAASSMSPTLQADCANLATALDDRHRDTTFAIAGFVGAGVGAAAFAATLVLWKTSPQAKSSVTIIPMVGTSGGGLSLRWAH